MNQLLYRPLPAVWVAALLVLTPIRLLAQAQEWNEISEGERLFALQVAPALEAKCFACHGENAKQIESGLDLTSRRSMLAGGDSGDQVLVPGDHAASMLYLSATWQHDYLQMPPKENDKLDAPTLEALAKWIDLEAPWPKASRVAEIRRQLSTGVTVATSGGLSPSWDERRYEPETLWAYRPLAKPPVPRANGLPAENPIDSFINRRLRQLDIQPAPRASRTDLIRRVYFDLLGLPPSPREVSKFVTDPAPDHVAWERVVDRLLASSRMGERWAQHWLDTVRYADSAGFANDYQRPNAWRYRDYVVRSINQDKPLDQFIEEQVAGDEIDPHDPEMLIAVGMLRMGPWEHTGMSVDKVTRQQFLDDVTDMIGQTFLAHPLQCARCHDHKFDPIPTRDYYRIQAVFATTQFAERDAAFVQGENRSGFEEKTKYLRKRIERYEALLQRLNHKEEQNARRWYAERGLEYAPRSQKLKQGVAEENIAPRRVGFQAMDFGLERIARKYLERHRWELDRYRPIALSVYSGPTPSRRRVHDRITMPANPKNAGKIEKTAILTGGDPFSPSVSVTPGVLSVLTGMLGVDDARGASSVQTEAVGRRTEFARWLTDPNRNPITPRVMVNRLWHHHFGQGIVKTLNNFGTAGGQPSHPELLDFLASELVDSGWSSKHVHRMILTSQAYCRSSRWSKDVAEREEALTQKDIDGTSYARFSMRRLTAEELRDAALAVGGLLNDEIGGSPIRPRVNAEVAMQPRQIMGTYAPVYQASPRPEDRHRRTLYALKLRGLRDPMLEVFNQPSPDFVCEFRDSSTVAPQALTMFNSPIFYNRALAMARHLLHDIQNGPSDSAELDAAAKAIEFDRNKSNGDPQAEQPVSTAVQRRRVLMRAYQLVYGRQPTERELQVCLEHWRRMQGKHEKISLPDIQPPEEVTREFVDENTGGSFTYTEPLLRNRDFIPAVQPSQASPATRGLAEVCLVLLSSNEFLYVP